LFAQFRVYGDKKPSRGPEEILHACRYLRRNHYAKFDEDMGLGVAGVKFQAFPMCSRSLQYSRTTVQVCDVALPYYGMT